MTKSELFKAAHKIARETKAIAGSYRLAFACALRDLYAGVANMKSELTLEAEAFAAEINAAIAAHKAASTKMNSKRLLTVANTARIQSFRMSLRDAQDAAAVQAFRAVDFEALKEELRFARINVANCSNW